MARKNGHAIALLLLWGIAIPSPTAQGTLMVVAADANVIAARLRPLDVLYHGEVAPAHLSGGGLLAGSRGQGGWENAIAAIESQAEELEARADEVRGAIYPETNVGLKLRHEAGAFRVVELEINGPAALSGAIESDDELVAIDQTPVRGLNLFEATALLRGPPSSDIVLTVLRQGCSRNVTLQRCAHIASAPRIRLSSDDRLRLATGGGLSASAGVWNAGITLGKDLTVENVVAHSSAAVAGVRKGDTLLSVDSMRVTGGLPSKVSTLLTSRHRGAVLHLLFTRCTDADSDHPQYDETSMSQKGKQALVSVQVCCSEACEGIGGDDNGGGDGSKGSLKFPTSTKQTIKAVTGLFKGFFK